MADYGGAITPPEIRLVDWAAMPTDWYQQAGEAAQEMEAPEGYGSFDRGVDLMQAMLAAGTMATGKRLEDAGFETVGKWLFSTPKEMYERNIESAMQMQRKRLEESEGLGDAASWFLETAKEQGPMMAIPIAAGVTGSAVLSRVARGLTAVPHPLVKSLGFMGGAFLASYSLQLGEAYSSMIEEGGNVDHQEAHKAAMLAASLDIITPAYLFGKLPIVGPSLARRFKRDTAKKIFSGSELGKKLMFVAGAVISEGATEGMQEAIIENAVNFVNGLDKNEFTKEQWEQIREAAYAGGAMGGGISIITPRGTRPSEPTPEPEAEPAIEEAPAEDILEFGPPAGPVIFTGFERGIPGRPTTDYDVAPARRGVERSEVEETPTIRSLLDVLKRRRSQLESGEVPPVTEGRRRRTPLTREELAGATIPAATERRRTLPKKVPPITKPIPDGSPTLDLNTGVDARVGRTYDAATRRPLSREQRQQAQKDMDDLVSRQRKEEADVRKDDSEIEKLTVSRASDVASEDFETWTDEGLTEESRIRMFQEKAKSILRATNEKVASAYRSTFAKRLGEYRKLAAGMAITGERGPARGGPKPREEGGGPKPREVEAKTARRGVVSGMAVANEAIPGMTIEQTPDGLWNLQLGDEVLGTYESGNAANRRGRSLTQAQYDRRISQIAKEREVVEKPAVTTTVEKVETKDEKAAEKQKEIDKRAQEAAEKQAQDLENKEAAEDLAKAKAEIEADRKKQALKDREEEIVDKAVKDERTVPQIVKDINYTAQYKKLSKAGKSEVGALVAKAEESGAELDSRVAQEIDEIIEMEEEVVGRDGDDFFSPAAITAAINEANRPGTRETVIVMSPQEFLDMSLPMGDVEIVKRRLAKLPDKGWSEIPHLHFIDDGKGVAKVVNHEGRHRMTRLKEANIKEVLVTFRSITSKSDQEWVSPERSGTGGGDAIQWNIEGDKKVWPDTLVSQNALEEMPFPKSIISPNKEVAPTKKAKKPKVPVRVTGERAERTTTQKATFAAMKKIPNVTGANEVLAMDPETFLWKVNNTKSQGGYDLSQLRKIAEGAGLNAALTRPQLVESLKLWYGQQNNPKDTLTDEELKKITGEYETTTDGNISETRFNSARKIIIHEGEQVVVDDRTGRLLSVIPLETSEVQSKLLGEMIRIFGRDATRNMRSLGFINFVTRADLKNKKYVGVSYDEMSDGNTTAFVDHDNGQVFFVTDVISARYLEFELKGLILHELGVHFGRHILTDTEWTSVKAALLELYANKDPLIVEAYNLAAAQTERLYGPVWNEQHLDYLWEETLAYFATANPGKIKTGTTKDIWETIEQAVRRFFKNLLLKFDPEYRGAEAKITSDDIADLISHMTWHVPDIALSRFGDSEKTKHLRLQRREEFLVDDRGRRSVVDEPVYHGTLADFHFPVLEVMDLGMHFGTIDAALEVMQREREDNARRAKERGDRPDTGSHMGKYYINIKKPLILNTDLIQWRSPYAWYDHTFNYEVPLLELADKKTGKRFDEKSGLTMFDREGVSPLVDKQWKSFITKWNERLPNDKLRDMEFDKALKELNAFREDFVMFWKKRGYDGIQYVNLKEDKFSTSYMVFDSDQVAPTDSFSFNSTSRGISHARAIGGTQAQNISENRAAAESAADTVKGTYEGRAKARTAWQAIRRFFEPLSMVPGSRELLIRRYQARGETTLGENIAKNVYDIFSQATEQEKTAIYKYLTTKDASPNAIPDRQISYATRETILRGRKPRETGRQAAKASLRQTAVDAKENIHNLGQQLVDLGLLSETRFTKLESAYLPKMYLRYLLGDEYKRSLGAGMKPGPMDYVKARKLHEEWVADLLYGEIKDPEFLASRYISQVTQDIAIVEYLNFIVSDPGNNGWVLPNGTADFRGKKVSSYWLESEGDFLLNTANVKAVTDPETAAEMRQLSKEMQDAARKAEPGISAYDAQKYRQIPRHPKFGAMGGIYVLKEIYQDVMGIAAPGGEQATVAKFFTTAGLGGKTQQVFKYTRVIANPPTLMRNIFSNMVLLHTSGVSLLRIPGRLGQAMDQILNDGEYYKIAQRYGIEIGTFTSEEIRRIDLEYTAIKKNKGLTDKLKLFIGAAAGPGSRFYQKSEVLFKLAKLIDGMESKGLSEGEAALEAQEAILDYSLVSPSIRWLRSVPFGAPFITFQVKVLPQLIKNLRKHPMSFAPYAALPYIMAQIFAAENDVDEEDLRKLKKHMGDWARDRGSIYFLPSRGDDGKWRAVDIGYMLPWTAWWETARDMQRTEFGEAWQETGLFSGPIDVLKGMESNVDPFTQQPIWNELDPPQQQYLDIMQFMASYMVPPFMSPRNKAGAITTGGGPLIKIMMAGGLKDGNIGEDGLPKYDIPWSIMAMFGFNTYTINPQEQLHKNLRWMTVDLQKTQRRMIQLMTEPGVTDKQREELAHEYIAHIQNKTAEIQEYVESVKGMSEKLK